MASSSLLLTFLAFTLLLTTNYQLPTIFAETTVDCGSNPRADGLITTPDLSGKFGTTANVCITKEDRAAFVSYKIPNYNDLKSTYYTQAKPSNSLNKIAPFGNNPSLGQFASPLASKKISTVFLVNGSMTIDNPFLPTASDNALVFVEEDLNIQNNITYGGNNYGLVFVVKGNINIEPDVTQVDAVLISADKIFTGGANCISNLTTEVSPGVPVEQLIINGSLISLNRDNQIEFCRNLNDNSIPAEKINLQPKYLVILKDIYSENLQKWTEVTGPLFALVPPTPIALPLPKITILANDSSEPIIVPDGSSVDLSWETKNFPTSCTASGDWSGNKQINGGETISNLEGGRDYNYSLACENLTGESSSTVTVTVSPPTPPGVNLRAKSGADTPSDGPLSLGNGSSIELSWTTTSSPTSCSASGDWNGNKGVNGGNQTIGPLNGPSSKIYTLTCSKPSLAGAPDSVRVDVSGPIPTPPTGLTANPCPSPGTTANLSWSVATNATYYLVRVDKQPFDLASCSSPGAEDLCSEPNNPTSPAYTFNSTAGSSYNWWVHACNATGCSIETTASFSCGDASSPTPTSTPTVAPQNWYLDADNDGFSNGSSAISSSTSPGTGYKTAVSGTDDCNDGNANIYIDKNVTKDADRDGFTAQGARRHNECVGNSGIFQSGGSHYTDADGSYTWWEHRVTSTEDCDDTNPTLSTSCIAETAYKRVFVTSQTYNGNLHGVSGANRECRDAGDDLEGTWKAWISDSTKSPANQSDEDVWNQYGGEYRLVDGTTKVADSWTDLVTLDADGTNYLKNRINKDENGVDIVATTLNWSVWTGSSPIGNRSGGVCDNWSSSSGSYTGASGTANYQTSYWTEFTNFSCTQVKHLYCFEQ